MIQMGSSEEKIAKTSLATYSLQSKNLANNIMGIRATTNKRDMRPRRKRRPKSYTGRENLKKLVRLKSLRV
jgi:hypothetical protein